MGFACRLRLMDWIYLLRGVLFRFNVSIDDLRDLHLYCVLVSSCLLVSRFVHPLIFLPVVASPSSKLRPNSTFGGSPSSQSRNSLHLPPRLRDLLPPSLHPNLDFLLQDRPTSSSKVPTCCKAIIRSPSPTSPSNAISLATRYECVAFSFLWSTRH